MNEIGWILLGAIIAWMASRLSGRLPRAQGRSRQGAEERPSAPMPAAALDRSMAETRSNLLLALENVPGEQARPETAELERAIRAATELTLQLLHLRNGLFPPVDTAPAAAADVPEPRGTETILVVDDEPGIRALARRTLERLGYTVLEAADPLEALTLLQKSGDVVDLLVTDVMMPHMSGVELVQRMRDRWPLVRILYISGVAQPDVERQGRPLLPKPFSAEQLTHSVRGALDALPDPSDATPPPNALQP